MSPEQVQSDEITHRADLYALGATMYELLTGDRPFKANNLGKLLHQIVYSTPPPIHTLRAEIPEELENIVSKAMQKDPENRFKNGNEFAAALTKVFKNLRSQNDTVDRQERYDTLRKLRFFHEFSHSEIWELLRASEWREMERGEEIVREGEMDDRFYVIVDGGVGGRVCRQIVGNGEGRQHDAGSGFSCPRRDFAPVVRNHITRRRGVMNEERATADTRRLRLDKTQHPLHRHRRIDGGATSA